MFTFKREKGAYLFPKYIRNDGKFYIRCSPATGKFKVYETSTDEVVAVFNKLKEAKEVYCN